MLSALGDVLLPESLTERPLRLALFDQVTTEGKEIHMGRVLSGVLQGGMVRVCARCICVCVCLLRHLANTSDRQVSCAAVP